jgi:hypothetical protein
VRNRGQLTGIPRLKPLEDPPDKLNGLIHSQFSRINSQIRPLLSPNHHSTTTTSETDSSQSNVSLLTLNISIIQSFAVLETAVSAAVAAGRLKGMPEISKCSPINNLSTIIIELLPINTIAAAESTALIRSQPSIANDQQTEAVMFRYKLISSGGCKPATWSADEYIGALQQLLNWDQRLTRYYMNVYRLARFSGRPLDPSLYRDAMKCLVILLKNVEK